MRQPAALGGVPSFAAVIDIVKPALPPLDAIAEDLASAMKSGQITNNSQFVRQFESLVCEQLGVANCVAMCNGTLTLVLALKGMGISGKVIVPSFTFCATVHSVVWAGLEPVFADVDPNTFNITPSTVADVLTDEVSALMPVHVFGGPCDIEGLEGLAREHNLKLLFDSAQAMGSKYAGRQVGSFGDAESFSLHATKILPTGEGGLVTTEDDELADYLRSSRSFGIDGDVDCLSAGLNAKMAEFPALLGIEGLRLLDSAIATRRTAVETYRELLGSIPGLGFQRFLPESETNYQNAIVVVDELEFGLSRDELQRGLAAENIMSRKYFYPAVHGTTAYAHLFEESDGRLPITNLLSRGTLCLPLYSEMQIDIVERVSGAILALHDYAPRVREALSSTV